MAKKLKRADVVKNASLQVSHSINKIKENERKYTIILVLIFMSIFAFFGYFTMSVSQGYKQEKVEMASYALADLNLDSNNVLLDEDDVMDDLLGLKKAPIALILSNEGVDDIHYQIKFVIDDMSSVCTCDRSNINNSLIHYSTDFENALVLEDNGIIFDDIIYAGEKRLKEIVLWVNDISNNHIHGHFEINRVY